MTTGSYTSRQAVPRWTELESIVGSDHFHVADQTDAIDGVLPARIVSPGTIEEISETLTWAEAAGLRVSARGGGTKLGWGNVPSGADLIVSMERLSGLGQHAWEDMTFTVKAGTTISALQTQLGHHRQRLALDPLWPERSTVGGVVATNDSGALRIRFGSVRDLILGAMIVLPNGTIARSGGKVVKNVAGYDLPKLLTGSFGTLGVIADATFRAHPLPQSTRTFSFDFVDLAAAGKFVLAVADSTLVPTGLQLRSGIGKLPVVDVRFEGLEEGIDAQAARSVELAGGCDGYIESSADVWWSRESLWHGESIAVVGKVSVLPTAIASAVEIVRNQFRFFKAIVQSTGIGLFRGECDSLEQLSQSLQDLRTRLQAVGGSLIMLNLPLELKRQINVFGPVNDSYPLMQRIKQQFDPNGTLNPGRFVGGI